MTTLHAADGLYAEVHAERIRAHHKHRAKPGGSMEQKGPDAPDWVPVLTEELGEVCRVINDHRHGIYGEGLAAHEEYRRELRAELVQLAAMACAWIDSLDHA